MDVVDKELAKVYDDIKDDIEAIYKKYEFVAGLDIPELDEKEAKIKLFKTMQKACDELKEKIIKEMEES